MDKLLCIFAVILVAYFIYTVITRETEPFWGGYFPMPYTGQRAVMYGRYGYDAATDDPRMLINPCAYPINPTNS